MRTLGLLLLLLASNIFVVQSAFADQAAKDSWADIGSRKFHWVGDASKEIVIRDGHQTDIPAGCDQYCDTSPGPHFANCTTF